MHKHEFITINIAESNYLQAVGAGHFEAFSKNAPQSKAQGVNMKLKCPTSFIRPEWSRVRLHYSDAATRALMSVDARRNGVGVVGHRVNHDLIVMRIGLFKDRKVVILFE